MIRTAVFPTVRRLVIAGGIALVALGGYSAAAGAAGSSGPATTAPYTDQNAVGTIGLCNQAGQQVTSGSTTAAPFAWLAVSTTPAPAPYDNDSRTAILNAYQPQNGLPPGEWSGAELTASSRYTNPQVPMAAATSGDDSLADFMDNYHPRWDGFLQLRMYLGTADQPQYSLHYPALNIQVVGDTWYAVGGGTVNCTAGTAESIESIVLPSATTTTPASTPVHRSSSSSGSSSPGAASHPSSAGATPTGSGAATPVAATQTGSSLGWLAIVLLVILVVAAAWFLVRRLRPGARGGSSGPDPGDPDPGDASAAAADVPAHGPTEAGAPDPREPDRLDSDLTVSSTSSASPTSTKGQHQ